MAYFRQCFPSNLNITTIKELAHALASHPPYEIPISSIKIKHLHCQVVSSEDSENLSPCIGLGIVRGIDTFKRLLYVLTPVPQSAL
ncbi:Polynucleotide 5'-hydroxyl-kinase NOL9 [Vitis vinifera]|uniref:Polynucleotide 5'-hydroxyl-kinase NOL9 n=1 Tax=Vitis vinifera TaxID=29760 RepID=A0A438DJD1_VITVI|nr:Polynucleotide 5'-hydroxyl-kinase NOL9 [Vitis vinifera]